MKSLGHIRYSWVEETDKYDVDDVDKNKKDDYVFN